MPYSGPLFLDLRAFWGFLFWQLWAVGDMPARCHKLFDLIIK
jgi:hypothetical protein